MRKNLLILTLLASAAVLWAGGPVGAAVTLIEPGHVLTQIVDSAVPLHPSQTALDTACIVFGNTGNIESIAIDSSTGTLYVQVASGGFKNTGAVALVNPSTGFGVNSRGTDLHFDSFTGLLVTEDQNTLPERIATVNPLTGMTGTYSQVTAPIFSTGTFGMDFSRGIGGTDVPLGDVVFTSDVAASGIHSVPVHSPPLEAT